MYTTDQTGKQICIPYSPCRIISLVPSQTELLYFLGLETEVVGITKFCIHPAEWFKTKKRVGGTKTPDISLIKSLSPDLIIANKEENNPHDVAEMEKFCPVWTSHIQAADDAMNMIKSIGQITNTDQKAESLIQQIKQAFQQIQPLKNKRVLYLIWKDPYMTVGNDTFIHDLLQTVGFVNVFADRTRYPEVSKEQLINTEADFIFLSSEPYPFRDKHIREINMLFENQKFKKPETVLVNGEYFSWYGNRMLQAASYLSTLAEKLTHGAA